MIELEKAGVRAEDNFMKRIRNVKFGNNCNLVEPCNL